jgi:acetoin utilization protein AcuB
MKTLRDVMTADPIRVGPRTPVREALELLESGTIRHLPVTDGDAVVGMLSDRGLRPWRQALLDVREREAPPMAEEILAQPVEAFMTREVLFLEADRPIVDAIDVMLDFKVGAIPVVQRGRLVGIVSYVDLLEVLQAMLRG